MKRGERNERETSSSDFFSSKDIMVCDKTKQDTVKAKNKITETFPIIFTVNYFGQRLKKIKKTLISFFNFS